MAKVIVATRQRVVVNFSAGQVRGAITAGQRGTYLFNVQTSRHTGLNHAELADFADAIRKACKHIGKVIGKEVSLGGRRIDPDEPTLDKSIDITVTSRVFPNNTLATISFTRYADSGQVRAEVPSMLFADIPSAIQYAFVCTQTSELMKKYATW